MSDAARPTPLGHLLLLMVRLYQTVVSPYCQPRCRYLPSCSVFAHQAVHQHGAAVGCLHAVRRLLRCAPWGGSGYDPVPSVGARSGV